MLDDPERGAGGGAISSRPICGDGVAPCGEGLSLVTRDDAAFGMAVRASPSALGCREGEAGPICAGTKHGRTNGVGGVRARLAYSGARRIKASIQNPRWESTVEGVTERPRPRRVN